MIGIFDSGSGGLTVLKPVRNRFPNADIVYFGDTKNAPYGNRSQDELTRLTVDALRLLHQQGATSIISACNSVSASLSMSLFDILDLSPDRLIEMVGPTAASLRDSSERILLCATAATIRSQIYQSAFHMLGKEIKTLALPELAGAIEAGKSQEDIEAIIRTGFDTVDTDSFDAVVLSCTHYPLVANLFKKMLPERIRLIDPGEAVADRALRDWTEEEEGKGTLRFLISQDSAPFRELVAMHFPDTPYEIQVL